MCGWFNPLFSYPVCQETGHLWAPLGQFYHYYFFPQPVNGRCRLWNPLRLRLAELNHMMRGDIFRSESWRGRRIQCSWQSPRKRLGYLKKKKREGKRSRSDCYPSCLMICHWLRFDLVWPSYRSSIFTDNISLHSWISWQGTWLTYPYGPNQTFTLFCFYFKCPWSW